MELKELLDKHSYNSYECNDDKTVWVISEKQMKDLLEEYDSIKIIYCCEFLDIPIGEIGMFEGKKYKAVKCETCEDCFFLNKSCSKVLCTSEDTEDSIDKIYKIVE